MGYLEVYTPLNASAQEIRLLTLQPARGKDADVISCTLRAVSLIDKQPFTALSYVWGDPNVTEVVLVNNQILRVTRNLAAALHQLREDFSEEAEISFWVDAICIDQSNILERNSQVSANEGYLHQRKGRHGVAWCQ